MTRLRSLHGLWMLVLIGLATLLPACQNAQPLAQAQVCSHQALPAIRHVTPATSSSQTVYVSSGVYLYALNAGSGKVQWCTHYLESKLGSPLGLLTLKDRQLYAGVEDGLMAAFDPASGALKWSVYLAGSSYFGSPVVNNGLLYGGDIDMSALNVQDGSVHWRFPLQKGTGVTGVTSVPAVAHGAIYFGTELCCLKQGATQTALYALDATTGAKRWVEQWSSSDERNPIQINTPPVVEQGIVCVVVDGISHHMVQALDAQTGRRLWQYPTSRTQKLQAANGLLYVSDGENF